MDARRRPAPPTVGVRLVRPADVPALLALAAATSTGSLHSRFFLATRTVPGQVAAGLADVDQGRHAAVAAWYGTGPVGWAQYDAVPDAPAEADLAVLVTDAWQARGIGPVLVRALAVVACANGFGWFTATTRTDNAPARRALRRLWPDLTPALHDGAFEWRLPLCRPGGPGGWRPRGPGG